MDVLVNNKKLNGCLASVSSKSYAQRALFLSILAGGESRIFIKDLSDDIKVALDITRSLAHVKKEGNTYIINPRKAPSTIKINAGESGTCLRLIIPILARLGIKSRIKREGSLVNRTIDLYKEVLPQKGVAISEEADFINLEGRLFPGEYSLAGNISSQFISGLLIALASFEEESTIRLTSGLESKPYVDMTIEMVEKFGAKVSIEDRTYRLRGPYRPTDYITDTDWSSALFFIIGGAEVTGLRENSLQADMLAMDYLTSIGYKDVGVDGIRLSRSNRIEKDRIIDAKDMPDAVPALSIISALSPGTTKVINTRRLRLKESNRVVSTCHMLKNFGLQVKAYDDYFIFNSIASFKPGSIDSYNDHRIAMAASIGASFAEDKVLIKNAGVVAKSYPKFYNDFRKLGGEYSVQ